MGRWSILGREHQVEDVDLERAGDALEPPERDVHVSSQERVELVLDTRKQAGNVDVTALGLKDLREGSTCAKRKHGLTLLKERGSGRAAVRAIDAASRRSGNNCMWYSDYDGARKSVWSRRAGR